MNFSETVLNAIIDFGVEHKIFSSKGCAFYDSRTIVIEVIDSTIVKDLKNCSKVKKYSESGVISEFYMSYFLPMLKKATLPDSDQTIYEALKERKFKEELKLAQHAIQYDLDSVTFEYHIF